MPTRMTEFQFIIDIDMIGYAYLESRFSSFTPKVLKVSTHGKQKKTLKNTTRMAITRRLMEGTIAMARMMKMKAATSKERAK